MNILFATAELAPLVKIGGLADVAGALPKALHKLGHDVRVIMPGYAMIDQEKYPRQPFVPPFSLTIGKARLTVAISRGHIPQSSVMVYFVECPELFDTVYATGEPSGLHDEMRRFVFFSSIVVTCLNQLRWQPDIIHCQDWHTALIPTLLRVRGGDVIPKTILTIHNLGSQGKWKAKEILAWLGFSGKETPLLRLRDEGKDFNALQQGIHAADVVTTVSPNYAREIMIAEYAEGLHDDLAARPDHVLGIVNGIDTDAFNPATDHVLAAPYDAANAGPQKRINKLAVQRRLGLAENADAPLFISIGRLTTQKGIDLLFSSLDFLIGAGGQAAFLGAGSPDIERQLQHIAQASPHHIGVHIGYDASLGNALYGGGDFVLMPSRFEPCGLVQMIAMRYGTVPVVRDTGGLHDTVIDMDQPGGTGLVFTEATSASADRAIRRALELYRRPAAFAAVQAAGMARDFSWYTSAQEYSSLYAKTITKK